MHPSPQQHSQQCNRAESRSAAPAGLLPGLKSAESRLQTHGPVKNATARGSLSLVRRPPGSRKAQPRAGPAVESLPPGLPRSRRLKHTQTPCQPARCQDGETVACKRKPGEHHAKSLASPITGGHAITGIWHRSQVTLETRKVFIPEQSHRDIPKHADHPSPEAGTTVGQGVTH